MALRSGRSRRLAHFAITIAGAYSFGLTFTSTRFAEMKMGLIAAVKLLREISGEGQGAPSRPPVTSCLQLWRTFLRWVASKAGGNRGSYTVYVIQTDEDSGQACP
ncbi:hypothetical protein, partial [Mesorhizobium sp.]|uniref:hypothetical protein n=1 Tax=Mesorhizobium sp. TaxID=1871066 RepID=UPI0025B890DF